MRPTTIALACATAALLPVTGCSLTEPTENKSKDGTISVTSSAAACELSRTRAKAGTVSFRVKNTGDAVTEFYLYKADGTSIVGEVENIGPGLTRSLVARVEAGRYVTACKPGMKGKGIRASFEVSGSSQGAATIRGLSSESIAKATTQYQGFVQGQSDRLLAATHRFVTAYENGQDARARALYPHARSFWERIEPVAESFGDLDPKTDAREADLSPDETWTGWHRIEKDLWPPTIGYTRLSTAQRKVYGDDLAQNIGTLHARVRKLTYTIDQIGNGSKSLLDEVATGKVTGEEDIWSHTDLYDFQANVEGARTAYRILQPLLADKDPRLSRTIRTRFAALQGLLDRYRRGNGFVGYDQVSMRERRRLSDAVNALSEPLSQLTGALTL